MTTDTIEEVPSEVADAAAEQAAAEAAFGSTRGVEPQPVAKQEPETPPEKSADEIAAEQQSAEDAEQAQFEEWQKTLPKQAREMFTAVTGVTGRLRNIEGHIGGLTSQQKEIRAALTASRDAEKSGDEAPTGSQIAAASGSSEKWNQMKEDFPEWAEAMEERLANVKGTSQPPVDRDAIKAELKAELALEAVEDAHEGWQETVKKPEFSTWLQSQPEEMQALAASTKPRDAIRLLNKYTGKAPAAETPPRQDPKTRLEASVAPTRGTTVARRETQTEQEAAEAAWKKTRGGG